MGLISQLFIKLFLLLILNLSVRADEDLHGILKLNDVFERINSFHPALQYTELNRKSAQASLLGAKSAFIPKIMARPLLIENYLNENYKRKKGITSAGEITWTSPFGLKIAIGIRSTNKSILSDDGLTYPSNKAVFDSVKKIKLNGFTDDEAVLGLKMPLLRGLIIDEERADLQISKLLSPKADLEIKQKKAELFKKAGEKYWEWVNAGLQYKVVQKITQLAKERTKAVQERVNSGAIPPIDYIEAQAQVQSREEALAKARRNFEKESIALSIYLWNSELIFSTPIENNLPNQMPNPISITEEIWRKHLELSSSLRPEIKLLEIDNQTEKINLRLAKNELLPVLDLEVLPTQDLSNFDSGTNIRGALNLEMPLAPWKARSKILKHQINLEKNSLNKNLLQAQINNEIKDALSYIETSRERVFNAKSALDKIGQLLEGEEMRFNFGGSSLFLINAREVSVMEAENKVLEALSDHQKALINYRYSVGEWSIPEFVPYMELSNL